MLAADRRSVDGHLAASTPGRTGMDCTPSNYANKKLIQARLPFKRLSPEPKENRQPKRLCAHATPEAKVSLRDSDTDSSPCPVRSTPALVNGRGPLDGFLSRRAPASSNENMVIDLTGDLSPVKQHVSAVVASHSLSEKDKIHTDKTTTSGTCSNSNHTPEIHSLSCRVVSKDGDMKEVEEKDENHGACVLQLDTTEDSESEPDMQDGSADTSSLGNGSMLSPSSVSSMCESSPETSKTAGPAPAAAPTEPKTSPKTPVDQKVKRCSTKSLQEQEERLRLRQEKERQKEEAKAAKEKKKEEARKLKEERLREKQEKKEREEREKRERKEKEEKEKAERLKAKEDLRKSKMEAKLEEKRKKEEEKRLKEEEKRLKEEKDRLKAEKAEITRFLQKPRIQQAPKILAAACGKFAPFEIKENMFLAPLCRVQCDNSVLEELDQHLMNPPDKIYVLKDWIRQKPRWSGPTKSRQTDALRECMLVVEGPQPNSVMDRKHYGPMKLLQFHENYRPAYWGTWSKKSLHVSPRCPFRQDKDLLDYEIDSDEEWEEEEPGESLSHSEGEDEEEGGDDDDDDDDGFFVPHGYLSDGEGALEEEDGGDLEKQKLRQKLKAREWDELMSSKKMNVLEPVVTGCVWEGDGPGLELLQPYTVCLVEPLPKADTSPMTDELSHKRQREDKLLRQLLPLLHGNVNSSKVIIAEFQEFWRQQATSSSLPSPDHSSSQNSKEKIPSSMHLKRLIKNSAVFERRSSYRHRCWYVHPDVLGRFGQEGLQLPCQWTYLTTGTRAGSPEEPQTGTVSQANCVSTPQISTSSSSSKRKSTGSMSITKFMKKCPDAEQMETVETDGFQADTEDDDEEDCIILSPQNESTRQTSPSVGDGVMDTSASDSAAVLNAAGPTPATA